MRKKNNTQEFIEKAISIHGGKYNYSKTNYNRSNEKVVITCPIHGDFKQTPNNHLNGRGCPECAKSSRKSEDFISKAKKAHGEKYDYSKVNYVNSHTKVCIICPEHGEFWQTPGAHINLRNGCPKCSRQVIAGTLDSFIAKAKKVHGSKYDYSKAKYINSSTKVCIICPKHGEFWQSPNSHLSGNGCPLCGLEKCTVNKITTEEFILKAKKTWGELYDYSLTLYNGRHKRVKIICPKHGVVEVFPGAHLNPQKYSGCPKCNLEKKYEKNKKIKIEENSQKENKKELLKNEFIKKARSLYGEKYDYSKVDYINNKEKVCIICPEHGEFWQRPNDHICHGNVCPMCGKNGKRNKPYTQEEFIKLANENFGNYYDYRKTKYISMQKPIVVTCPLHGDFSIRPYDHLHHNCGCPEHHKKSSLELQIENFLKEKQIEYVYEKKFSWLGVQSIDFYLPKYNAGIECQGVQHFKPIEHWGGKKAFESLRERDVRKHDLCQINKIQLFYYTEKRFLKYLVKQGWAGFSDAEKIFEKIF